MAGIHPRSVAQNLTLVEWLRVCSKVDEMEQIPDCKFDVLHILRRGKTVTVTLCASAGRILHIDVVDAKLEQTKVEVQAQEVA